MTTATRTRKTTKPVRTATLGTLSDGKLLLCLTQDGVLRAYLLTSLASDFGTAFHLHKADAGDGHAEEYDVLLHGRESSCTCPGHEYRHHCKHVEAIEALIRSGKLAVAAKPAPAQPQPEQPAPVAPSAPETAKCCFECGRPSEGFYCERCGYL